MLEYTEGRKRGSLTLGGIAPGAGNFRPSAMGALDFTDGKQTTALKFRCAHPAIYFHFGGGFIFGTGLCFQIDHGGY